VTWVREFGYMFGNTIYSAALVIAVFMCGLGVGSYLGGRWADRWPGRLLTAYALLELAVGVLALGVALLLPQLGGALHGDGRAPSPRSVTSRVPVAGRRGPLRPVPVGLLAFDGGMGV
jgi:MFS family permease